MNPEIVQTVSDRNGIEYQLWKAGAVFSLVVWDLDSGELISRRNGPEDVIRARMKELLSKVEL